MDLKVKLSGSVIVNIFCFVVIVKGSCNQYTGPAGSVDCVMLRRWKKYQYGKCTRESDDGVHRYTCSPHKYFPTNEYCYMSCMFEKHGKTGGPISDDCSCVSSRCYRTNGEDCDWYTYCLERYSCSAKVSVVQFARQFCNISTTKKHKFTRVGNGWMRAVQRCIESKINPVLHSKKTSYCKTIEGFSHGTLQPCFLHTGLGWSSYSICDIKYTDWATVLWTSRALINDSANPGLKALLDVIGECKDGPLQKVFEFEGKATESGMRMIKLTAGNISQGLESTSASTKYDIVADRVAKQLAAQLRWEQNGVQWISVIGSHGNESEADEISFNIFLGSRSMFDINAEGVVSAEMNLTVLDLADAISNETLSLDLDDDLTFTEFCACRDMNCRETYLDVIPNLRPSTTTVTTTTEIRRPSTHKYITRNRAGFNHCSGAGCLATYAENTVTPRQNVASQRSSARSKVEPVVQNVLCALLLKYFTLHNLF